MSNTKRDVTQYVHTALFSTMKVICDQGLSSSKSKQYEHLKTIQMTSALNSNVMIALCDHWCQTNCLMFGCVGKH